MTLDGSVTRGEDGGWVVAFDRPLHHSPECVWAILTEPERLARWLGDVDVDLRVGGAFVIHFREMSVVMTGTITALEPYRVIEYTWLENYGMPGSMVRWEIVPAPAGCRLRLTHRFPAECRLTEMMSFLGGWHAFFDAIASAADGAFVPYANEQAFANGYRKRYLGDAASGEEVP